MYEKVTDSFIQSIQKPSRTFRAKIKINNAWHEGKLKDSGIILGSSSEEDISIGSCVAARVEITMENIEELFENTECEIQYGILLEDGSYEYIPMGFFTVQKLEEAGVNITFTGYDRMMKSEIIFISNLSYPATAIQVLDEACSQCGLTRGTTGLETVYITTRPEGYTCREIIGYVASMYGKFACIDRTGKLQIKWYEDSGFCLLPSRIFSFKKSQRDFEVGFLTCNIDKTTKLSTGNGRRGITFDNPWMTQERLKKLYAEKEIFSYRPAEVNFFGDIRLDPWDIVTATYLDGNKYKIPAMMLTQKYDGGINTTIASYGKTEEETEVDFKGPVTKSTERIYSDIMMVNEVVAKKVDAEWVLANTVTTDELKAVDAEILTIKNNYLKTNEAAIKYAQIDLANIKEGSITTAMLGTAVVGTTQIADGSITDAKIVSLTANKLAAGTIDAAKIDVVNLNCANLTVGSINGTQIAQGAIDINNLTSDLSSKIVQTEDDVIQALKEAGLAQNTANSALNASTAAQNKADAAVSNAGKAQEAASSAISIANTAQSMANTAKSAADTAQATANGKNTVFYQTTQPGGAGRKVNDIWYDTDDGNRMYYWNGSAWTARQFGTNAIANASITNALIADATIQNAKIANLDAAKITTGYISADRIAANTITAVKIASNAITSDKIASNAVTALKITAGAVETDKLAANAVTTAKISAGAVTAATIAANAVTTDKLSASAVTAVKLAANSVTADKIVAGTITAAKIAAKTITGNQIAANTITASNLSVSNLSAISADLGTMTAGIIKSTNYVSNTSGMQLNLSTGVWDSKHFKLKTDGTMSVDAGSIGNLKITSSGFVYGEEEKPFSAYISCTEKSSSLGYYGGGMQSGASVEAKHGAVEINAGVSVRITTQRIYLNDMDLSLGVTGYASNNNGSYWKFPDGTLICAKTMYFSGVSCDSSWGSWYESGELNLGNYAYSFSSTPYITATLYSENGTQAAGMIEAIYSKSTSRFGFTYITRPTPGTYNFAISLLAIGRWR